MGFPGIDLCYFMYWGHLFFQNDAYGCAGSLSIGCIITTDALRFVPIQELGCIEMRWDELGCVGMCWDVLGCVGMRRCVKDVEATRTSFSGRLLVLCCFDIDSIRSNTNLLPLVRFNLNSWTAGLLDQFLLFWSPSLQDSAYLCGPRAAWVWVVSVRFPGPNRSWVDLTIGPRPSASNSIIARNLQNS